MNTPFVDGDLEREHLLALKACIDYLTRKGITSVGEIVDKAMVSRADYGNFWRAAKPKPSIASKIYNMVFSLLKARHISCPRPMRAVFRYVFPMLDQFGNDTNVFSQCADAFVGEELFNVYEGVYGVYRYAAHLNVPPESAPSADKPVIVQRERDRIDARIVKAAMVILNNGASRWPAFEIRYQPRELSKITNPAVIVKGHVIPIRDFVYLVGKEENINSPMVIATRRVFVPTGIIEGVVTRKHELGRILASRVVFVRRQKDSSFVKECEGIGVFRESELTTEISEVKAMMYNDVGQYGKGNIIL